MPFPIDASRAFRFPSELQRLSAAVRDAGDYDETRWIEWKSGLDLTTPPGRVHLIKQILGFANRDPQVAAQWAGGYAYLLVGVCPGNVKGVTAVDHQRLTQDLSPYVGDDVTWSPEYVGLDGVTVLVVVVAPPRPGDLIHFLRKDILDPRGGQNVLHREGTIFIRRHAESRVANHDERLMLQRRVRASADVLEKVVVAPSRSSIESAPPVESRLRKIIGEQRETLLAARYEPEGASTGARSPLTASLWQVQRAAQDPRTREEYIAEVDAYLEKLFGVYQARLEAELAEHEPAALRLSASNGTERPFLGVRVTATVRREGVRVLEPEVEASGPLDLPDRPVPFGTPQVTYSALFSVRGFSVPSLLRRPHIFRPSWEITQTQGGVSVVFDPVDLRPDATVDLEPVPLWVEAEPGASLEVEWHAAGINAHGVAEGRFSLDVTTPP